MPYALIRRHASLIVVLLSVVSVTVALAQQPPSAQPTVLAEQTLDTLPTPPLIWVADWVTTAEAVSHQHEPGFVYAGAAAHTLTVGDHPVTIPLGQAAAIASGSHTHRAGTYLEMRLAAPDTPPLPGATRVFATDALQGLPAGAVNLRLVDVIVPAHGGQTNVHTHPGPEVVFVRTGTVLVQRGNKAPETLTTGAVRTIPADTAVQIRNPGSDPAAFLALFAVDPNRPFSSDASFDAAPRLLPDTAQGDTTAALLSLSLSLLTLLAGMALWRTGRPSSSPHRCA